MTFTEQKLKYPTLLILVLVLTARSKKSRVGATANKEIKRKTYKVLNHTEGESEILMALFTF